MKYINKKERNDLIGFNDLKLRIIGILVISSLFPVLVFKVTPVEDLVYYFQCFFISATHVFVFWFIDYWIVIFFRKKYIQFEDYKKRIIRQSIVLGFMTLVLSTLIDQVLHLCFGENLHGIEEVSFFTKYMSGLITTTVIISIYEGVYAFEMLKKGLIKNEELRRQNTQAQLEVLKNQVSPHFLFNSLNTLISVIPDDPKTAVLFTENLSNVYRYLLEIREKEVISLKQEMSCIRAYEFLLKIRFEDAVVINYPDMNNADSQYIIPLSVQMLMENAIKHNIVSQSKPLKINIKVAEDRLIVSNNLQSKLSKEPSTKVGLANIDKRYQLLMKKSIVIKKTEKEFIVEIPLVKIAELK
jgi:sensor histidine kinase YesM